MCVDTFVSVCLHVVCLCACMHVDMLRICLHQRFTDIHCVFCIVYCVLQTMMRNAGDGQVQFRMWGTSFSVLSICLCLCVCMYVCLCLAVCVFCCFVYVVRCTCLLQMRGVDKYNADKYNAGDGSI